MTLRRSPATAQRLPTRLRGRQAMSKDSGENLSHPDDVQSSLRDRIAAVLWENFDAAAPSLSMLDMADAVIRELGATTPS